MINIIRTTGTTTLYAKTIRFSSAIDYSNTALSLSLFTRFPDRYVITQFYYY